MNVMTIKWKKLLLSGLAITMALFLMTGCSQDNEAQENGQDALESQVETDFYLSPTAMAAEIELNDEAVALAATPAIGTSLTPQASGTLVSKNQKAVVDYSNTSDGYVMVKFTASTNKRLKVKVAGPRTADGYLYNINAGQWTTFPLSDGNGNYTVTVFENTEGNKYATVLTSSFSVSLSDEFAPFIRPNQYVNYSGASNTIAKAKALTQGVSDPLAKVEKVYDFVIENLTYDTQKAKTVQSGYLPNLDSVLASKKGICFDYAALMTGMLRSQGVPCQLVVGYAGNAYHAWVNVWVEGQGWVNGVIYFNGTAWQRMDPTFASSNHSNDAIMQYIGNGSNYSAKYLY